MADPDFQIGKGGGGGGLKKIFRPFGPRFGHNIRGNPGPLGPSLGSATASYSWSNFSCGFISVTL